MGIEDSSNLRFRFVSIFAQPASAHRSSSGYTHS
jgi:hypothetical protein